MLDQYQNIPMELRDRLQWVVAGPDKVPLNPRTGQPASVTDPGSWGSFDEACRCGMKNIGFVLTHADPYCIIDLDNKPEKPLSPEEWKVHEDILTHFASYTERSTSGRGYHVVIRGALKHGRRRGSVEVYSAERYMIFTGDVVRNAPIADYQQLLESLVATMPETLEGVELVQVDGVLDDAEIHEMAMRAVNGDKYDALCRGDWRAMGYESQSHADFALLAILAFYTRDNDQVRRLFRYSALGRRDKATRDNRYLDTALRKIRAKEPSPTDYAAVQAFADSMRAKAAPPPPPAPPAPPVAPPAPPVAPSAPPAPPAPSNAPAPARVGLYPPGLVGELARYFYSSADRPVHEVALLAALGLVAGVTGRAYNISNTGLNQYLLLVATTGTGKEDGPKGIDRMLATVRANVPVIDEFIGPGAFASGQALIRILDQRPCFLSVLGEFGLTLQALNDPRAPAAVVMLKRVLLDLYSKSGWRSVLRSTAYSDQEKNTKTVQAPNVSILGDTTPETFYDGISSADIADGLIPRFQIVEYTGPRPARNRNAGHPPSAELAQQFTELAVHALTMQNNRTCANVQIATDALMLLDQFDAECDAHMNRTHSAGEKQLWNRAHLKSLKLAGLLAVGMSPHNPVVTHELAHWAIEFTRNGTEAILRRFDEGDVGNGDAKQASELRRLVREYMNLSPSELKNYKVKPELQKAGVIPYAYLVTRTARLAAFYKDRRGAAGSLRAVLEVAVQTEQLSQVPTAEAATKFQTRQALYYPAGGW